MDDTAFRGTPVSIKNKFLEWLWRFSQSLLKSSSFLETMKKVENRTFKGDGFRWPSESLPTSVLWFWFTKPNLGSVVGSQEWEWKVRKQGFLKFEVLLMVGSVLSSERRIQLSMVVWSQTSWTGDPVRHCDGFTRARSQTPTQLLAQHPCCRREGEEPKQENVWVRIQIIY